MESNRVKIANSMNQQLTLRKVINNYYCVSHHQKQYLYKTLSKSK
jgi:hypothetical protein